MQNLKKIFLLLTVFITGAAVLIIEIVAVRILSPYFGNTIFSYSSVLTVILAALSVGYYLGGRLADLKPNLKWFYGIILVGGLAVLFLQLLVLIILPIVGNYFSLIYGPLIASLVLFFLPAFLLGTLSPYAIKLLQSESLPTAVGKVAGEVFFWSTLGSIFGSLITGFILIPRFGVNQIVIATGIILVILGFLGLKKAQADKRMLRPLILLGIALIFLLGELIFSQEFPGVVYQQDGVYERMVIWESDKEGKPVRILSQDKTISGGMYLDGADHLFAYSKYYVLYKIFKPEVKDILVIGGGAYTVPKAYFQELPEAEIEVAEIEPSLFALAQKYFAVPTSPRLKNYLADGRRFLKESDKQYDIIFADAFHSLYSLPVHLTTREFFELAKSKLKPGGIFLANLIGDLAKRPNSLIYSEMKTFNSVFSNSYFFATDSPQSDLAQNIIFVGFNSERQLDFKNLEVTGDGSDFIAELPEKIIDLSAVDFSDYPLFTDNFAPVEYLTAQVLRYLD